MSSVPVTFSLSRRGLLGSAAALAAVASCQPRAAQPPLVETSAPPLDPRDWTSVRAQFALDQRLAHLAAFVFAAPPAQVREAIARHRAGFDANTVEYLHANEGMMERSIHQWAAGYLGVRTDEIMFTDSTTMGLGLLYHGLKLSPGDEILTSEHDFFATHESLRFRAERDGVRVNRVRLYQDPFNTSVDEIVSNLARAFTPATKVVALTWVHSGTGVKLPVREIASFLNGRALLCLDSVHGFGAQDAGPAELGCDFLISGCHKWLFGPRGTGLIWGTPAAWARYQPSIPTFQPERRPQSTPGGYHAFEHQWALAETFDFHKRIGRDRIAARVHELNGRLKDGLAGIKGVRLITPRSPDLSAGIVCCVVGDSEPPELVVRLRDKGVVASASPYNPSYLRFGASIATLEADVDKAIDTVRGL
ncbi:aminotransferase class V-fold PLP-dependent enzyme [Allorhizocola rhizosphaerae]|uniref:aminotransferase class V-fold PLP-dependent enzyme n=1 Tax=Allorhizocola rhizosphaerae TaxID=1872709 RepID=UPI000E3B5895|nr:aminotransferase class V-fold PLP-dependent enzyme [Allorhizocola rhizosphaerae]